MCKGSVITVTLIIIACIAAGCESPDETAEVEPIRKRETPTVEQQQAAPRQQILEVKTAEQKAQEEKTRQEQATDIALSRSNPFLTKEEEETFRETRGRLIIEDMTLSAVMYSPPNSKVIIDGAILKEGDSINSKKIVEIQPKAVILKDDKTKREYILRTKKVTGTP